MLRHWGITFIERSHLEFLCGYSRVFLTWFYQMQINSKTLFDGIDWSTKQRQNDYVKARINKMQQNSRCRLSGDRD